MTRLCVVCGGAFVSRRGTIHRICSQRCRNRRDRGAEPRRNHKRERSCLTCGTAFRSEQAVYCSLACRPLQAEKPARDRVKLLERAERTARREADAEIARDHRAEVTAVQAAEREAARHKTCDRCGDPFYSKHAKRFCSAECRAPVHGLVTIACVTCGLPFETLHPNAKYCADTCRNKDYRRRPGEKRRKQAYERLKRLRPKVLEFYGTDCYLCTRPITIAADVAHPGALTLDHVVPIAQGGRDTIENLRPAHRACNEDKGERYPAWWELRQAGIAA
jgi:5-methylcytosine-specific restriction endonuclease McrA